MSTIRSVEKVEKEMRSQIMTRAMRTERKISLPSSVELWKTSEQAITSRMKSKSMITKNFNGISKTGPVKELNTDVSEDI